MASPLILRPNADSTPLGLTGSAGGSHYVLIDEASESTTDYVQVQGSSSSQELTDIYGFPNHTDESDTITSVTVKCQCKYIQTGTDTGTVYVNPSVKIGSTVYNSGNQNLTSSDALYTYAWTTNPATSSAWTWTNIDDLLAGIKMSSHYTGAKDYRDSYCYQLWVEVAYGAATGPVMPVFLYHYMNHC